MSFRKIDYTKPLHQSLNHSIDYTESASPYEDVDTNSNISIHNSSNNNNNTILAPDSVFIDNGYTDIRHSNDIEPFKIAQGKKNDSRSSSIEGYGSDIDEEEKDAYPIENNIVQENEVEIEDEVEGGEEGEGVRADIYSTTLEYIDVPSMSEAETIIETPENKVVTHKMTSPVQFNSQVLPTFQKRPLSDTPTHSQWNSPNNNNTPNISPLPSNLEMSEIDSSSTSLPKDIESNSDLIINTIGKSDSIVSKTQSLGTSQFMRPQMNSSFPNYTSLTDNEHALVSDTDYVYSTSEPESDSSYTTSRTSPRSSRHSAHSFIQHQQQQQQQQSSVSAADGEQDNNKIMRNQNIRKHLKRPPHKKRNSSIITTLDVPGLTISKISPDGHIAQQDAGSKLVIVMVGLPATGKSFLTNKLSRFLNFSMYDCKVFNVGNTRRDYSNKHRDEVPEQDANFFDPTNENSNHLREIWAMDTLDQLLDYLLDMHGNVAIFDATNTTKLRRHNVVNKIRERSRHLKIVFLESVCSDEELVANNIRLKLLGPDYKGKDAKMSLIDFENRLRQYRKAYQPLEDEEADTHNVSYIKMIDVGKKVISYNIQGYLASQTIYYLLNFNLSDRQIWITRNGESEYNVLGKIGGNSQLTSRGLKYAKALSKFIQVKRKEFAHFLKQKHIKLQQDLDIREASVQYSAGDNASKNKSSKNKTQIHQHAPNFFVWTSMLRRSVETAQFFNDDKFPTKQMKMLNELSAGDFEGLTYEDIQQEYPEEFEERVSDKLRYRYPGIGGESYFDVINRLRTVITELERITDNVLLICHRVVARVLLGYFLNLSKETYSNLDVPLHSVYCLETTPYGVTWKLFEYDELLDTFHEVPQDSINTKVVQQVGIVHKERRFSVVPTFSHRESNTRTSVSNIKRTNSSGTKTRPNTVTSVTNKDKTTSNPFHISRTVPISSIMHSQNSRNGAGSKLLRDSTRSRSNSPLLDTCQSNSTDTVNKPSKLERAGDQKENDTTKAELINTLQTHQLEIEKLTEKLRNLKQLSADD